MMLDGFLRQSARRTPDAVAVIEPSRTATYLELDRLANRVAHVLVASGVRRGDRVLVAGDNTVDSVGVYFGILRAGAVAVPLPSGPRNDRFGTAIADCRPAAGIVDAATARDAGCRNALEAVPHVFVLSPRTLPPLPRPLRDLRQVLEGAADTPPPVRAIDQDLAAIIYTSGSTGAPRGVMLTHRNLVSNARSIVEYLALTARDRVMCVLPFYYVYGLSLLHTHVAVGASIVLDNRFAYPGVVLTAMRERHVTGFAGVPSTFALLMTRPDFSSAELPELRYVTQAGGGMPPSRIVEWCTRVPGVPFYVMYGATEASARLTYLEPSVLMRKLGSIGRAIPNVQVRVIKDDGTEAAPGEVGELVARGANISCGYWNDADETRARFGPVGYRTGDLGYADDEGFLFLVGRRHEMIKTGAHRVGPREIEDVLSRHPAVAEAAVLGMAHDILGEVPVAVVALVPGASADADALGSFCQGHLASHKVPAKFFFVPELPKTGVGKIDKVRLRATLASGAESGQAV